MGRGVRLDRFGIGLLALALAAGSAAAQNAAAPAPGTGSSQSTVIGPAINDFNLNGRVTRQAEQPPPAASRPAPQPTSPATVDRPAQQPARTTREAPLRAAPQPTVPAASPTIAQSAPSPQPQVQQPAVEPPAAAPVAALPATVLPGEPGASPSLLPWILAALFAAGAGLFLFRRQRQQQDRYVEAVASPALAFDPGPQPEASAPPLARAPIAPPAPKSPSGGIVSNRLHPDIAIDLMPERAIVDDGGATIEFQVTVRNHGTAPARDVRVEACMVNAGPAQDQELGAFFEHPANTAEPIPHLMPMTEINLKSAVRLKLDQMRQFEVGGRRLFVPLVGVNALYRSSTGPAQTSASYFVGRDSKGEKMAPLRLDLGPRVFRGLGARQHTLGLRR